MARRSRRRTRTRAARRIVERTKRNVAAVEAGATAAEDAKSRPRVGRNVTHLDYLRSRGSISDTQADAGLHLARDFRASHSIIGSKMIGSYQANMPRPSRKYAVPAPDAPHVIEAREAVDAAVNALGPLVGIVFHVAVCDAAAGEWGATPQHRNGDAMALLRFGLSTLHRHYSEMRCPAINGRSPRAWAAAGALPPPPGSHSSGSAAAAP